MIKRQVWRAQRRVRWERYVASIYLRNALWDIVGWRDRDRVASTARIVDTTVTPTVNAYLQRSYLYVLSDVVVEPQYGYAIAAPGVLIDDISLAGSRYRRRRATMPGFGGTPSLRAYRTERQRSYDLESAILLRHTVEPNYYHALIDVLSSLGMLDLYGIGKEVPLIVSPTLARAPFFQALMAHRRLSERQWIIQTTALRVRALLSARRDTSSPATHA